MCCNNSEPKGSLSFAVVIGLAGLLVLSAAGCAAVSIDTPDGFLVVNETRTDIRATSSDGALLWVRTFDDPHGGDQAFWADALYNDLVDNRGYTMVEKNRAEAGSGARSVDGVEMLFETFTHGALHKYLIWLFVRANTICVVEFVGRPEPFSENVDAVRECVQSLTF